MRIFYKYNLQIKVIKNIMVVYLSELYRFCKALCNNFPYLKISRQIYSNVRKMLINSQEPMPKSFDCIEGNNR